MCVTAETFQRLKSKIDNRKLMSKVHLLKSSLPT